MTATPKLPIPRFLTVLILLIAATVVTPPPDVEAQNRWTLLGSVTGGDDMWTGCGGSGSSMNGWKTCIEIKNLPLGCRSKTLSIRKPIMQDGQTNVTISFYINCNDSCPANIYEILGMAVGLASMPFGPPGLILGGLSVVITVASYLDRCQETSDGSGE